jgi:hypothetical protein
VYTQALGLVPAGDDAVYERAATLQNMAPLQLRSGERAAGERAARSAVDEFRALYGSEHPSTASAEAVLAIVLARLGHHAEAAALTEAAIGRAADPTRPPLWMLLQAARLALLRRDHAGGLGWCARAEPQLTLPDGTRSPWSLPFAAVRARIAARTGDPQALEILDQVAGGAPTSGSSFVMLERAEILWEIGQRDAAEAIVQALVAEDNVAESEEEGVRLLLARALVARGALVAGMSLLHTLLGEREGVGLQEPERRAMALRTLAEAEAAAGHPQEAASRAREALLVLADFDEDSAALVDARRTAAELAARE